MDFYNSNFSKAELRKLMKGRTRADKKKLNSVVSQIVEENHFDVFDYLLEIGYNDLPILNKNNQTALHVTFYNRANNVAELIFETFTTYNEPNLSDCNGLTYFHVACNYAEENVIKKFLINGAEVNCQSYHKSDCCYSGFSPLHFGLRANYVDNIKLTNILLERGANANAVDDQGRTPFHIACRIFQCCHDIKENTTSVELMQILLEKNIDINAKDKNNNSPLLSIFPDDYDEFDTTYPWSDEGEIPVVETQQKFDLLIGHGADITATNNDGENILHRVVMTAKHSRYAANISFDDGFQVKMLEQILKINSNFDINAKNKKGESLMTLAMLYLSKDVVKFLLDKGADMSDVILKADVTFLLPDVVPNLETVEHVFATMKLLIDNGLTFNFGDDLGILKFLIHSKNNCHCGNLQLYYLNSFLTSYLACYGSDNHIKYVFDNYEQKYDMSNSYTRRDLNVYLYSVNFGQLYIDEEVKISIEDLLSKFTLPAIEKPAEIREECKKLKTIILENDVTLYDLLIKHHYDNIEYLNNNVVDYKMIENLNHYKNIVKGHITKSVLRNFVLKAARYYLKILLVVLPDVCCDVIVRYLPNEDVLNMCLATALAQGKC